ncbi:hypothetical protein EYC84_003160 [Monilinia fructicola]|uniref:Uncharacterized protein n=1 Tax=Monilinia fructicola TaxID=38448 RepID=A0A5M9K0X9_MONFR|nr:hypothetical protein EYC84_003160 [Monilinia fructicola]
MPSQAQIQRAREQQKAREILIARREAAAKKAAERKEAQKSQSSMVPKPTMTSGKLDSETSDPKPISAFTRIKKKAGTSMAEKKAAEQAAAAAKQKRAEQEMEEGEIDSDDEEVVFRGRQNKVTKTVEKMGKLPTTNSGPANPRDKSQMAPRRTHETKSALKTNSEGLKRRGESQTSEQQKKPEPKKPVPKKPAPKKQTSKRKIEVSDAESSEVEMAKPVKKQKTAKGGMNFENLPTKRKHGGEEEAPGPVKRQKTMDQAKNPVAAPAKRARAVKETHIRRDPNVNLLNFGPPPKKPAPKKAPTAPAKEAVVIEKKEVSKKSAKTVQSSTAPKVAPEKTQNRPGASTSTRSSPEATQSPPSEFTSVSDRIKSRRRGAAAAPNIQIKTSSSSSSTKPVEATRKARGSRSSKLSVNASEPVSEVSPVNRLPPLLSPTLPPIVESELAKRLKKIAEEKEEENMAREMEEELEKDRVDDLELPEPAVQASCSLAVELDPASDALLETDLNDYLDNLTPEVAAAVQAQQKEIDQAVESDAESVEDDDKFSSYQDTVETTKSPMSPAPEVPDSVQSKVTEDEEQLEEAEAPMKSRPSSSATSPAPLSDHIAAPEQHAIVSAEESLPRDDSDQNSNVSNQQNVARTSASTFKFAGEIGYESDMSEEDPDPEPSPVHSTPFEEAGDFDELELDVDEALEAQEFEANLEATEQDKELEPPDQVKVEVPSPEASVTGVEPLPELPLINNDVDVIDPQSPGQNDNTDENVEIANQSDESETSDKHSDEKMWDDNDTEALLQNHMVPAELGNVVTEEGSLDYKKLIAEVKAAREETIRWERENGELPEFTFSISRPDLLCHLGYSKDRVAKYMEVHKRYEDTVFPKPVAQCNAMRDLSGEESSGDESDDDQDDLRRRGYSVLIPRNYAWNHDDMVTDPNVHPFGPIN